MPIEWVAIAAALSPYLKKYAAERAEKLAATYADGAFASLYRRVVPDEKLQTVKRVFVTRFSKELDSVIDLPTLTADHYQETLQLFLCNPSAQDALQGPLDGHTALDGELLADIWAEFRTNKGENLIELPEDFDWPSVAKKYAITLRREALSNSELRPVIEALTTIRTAEATERSAKANEETAEAVGRLAGPAGSFDLARYAEAVNEAYRHLKLGSLDPDWTHYDRGVRLESVYVPQSAKQALPPRDLTRDYLRSLKDEKRADGVEADEEKLKRRKEEYSQLSTRPLMEVVDTPAHERLVILGDPGLGKSTLLKHLVLRWAEDPSRPLALLIELRQAHSNFLDYLEKGAGPTCCLPRVELDRHLKAEKSLVLFDGLDEVTEAARPDTVSAIIRFAGDYPKARVVVTTRIHGYSPGSTHPEQFRDAGFEQFTLQDFDPSEINRFIGLWHSEAFHNRAERSRYESRLQKALADSLAISELAANPLLLTMMAILSRNQDLPRDHGRLYERCAELLLKNWDLEKFPELQAKRQTRGLDIKDKLGPDQKIRILERVAEAMQKERTGLAGNLIAKDKLKPIVEDELVRLAVPEPWAVADDLIWMLQERNFMLAYLGDRQYAFVHRTFLEYFCARDLKYRLERTSGFTVDELRKLFRDRWRQDEWLEVLRLLCGLIGAEHAGKCASELLLEARQANGHEAVLLATQCLQEIRELGLIREVRSQTRQALDSLTRFDLTHYYESWEPGAKEVARVRSRAVQELARGWKDDPDTLGWLKERAAHDDNWAVRQAAVRELARGWKDDPATLGWLKDRAAHDDHVAVRQAAVRELARSWKNDPDTLGLLKERAAHDDHGAVRYMAVQELARGWKDDPDTVGWWLKDRAAHDDHVAVRQAAVRELARSWKNDPDTLGLLKDRAAHDDHGTVRRAAVQELAWGWKDDPDIVGWLKDRAAHDDNWAVRDAAVRELARGWKDDPDIVGWLKDRAAHDDNWAVRDAAVRELARGWKDDPDTVDMLKDRAAHDDDGDVRHAVVRELARGWKDDPDTAGWLKDRATQDDHAAVRQAAVKELARGWKDDPDTVKLLKEHAAQDDDWAVRQAAVRELARGWKDDSDTAELLKGRGAHDNYYTVRQAVVRELARGWKDDSDTMGWLTDRAAHDDHPAVRAAAAHELARGWRHDPDTVGWLKERAAHDDHGAVRQAAVQELARGWNDDPEVQAFLENFTAAKSR